MSNQNLILVFADTVETVDSTPKFQLSNTTKHTIEEISGPLGDNLANVKTINSDTVSAALKYVTEEGVSGRTAILNMASYKRPGGGVSNGARAQEECLFRCSNLSRVVPEHFYPLQVNEGLYTRDAIFFKDKNYSKIEPFNVDVITIAAINLKKENDKEILNNYDKIMKDKIRLMFDMALKNDCENIILGAWGCGVFNNNPVTVAQMFDDVINERKDSISASYAESFKNIIFAVINDHNSVGDNYDVFSKFFQ